jgi:hypothetical protein
MEHMKDEAQLQETTEKKNLNYIFQPDQVRPLFDLGTSK